MCASLCLFRVRGSGESLTIAPYRLDGPLFKMETVAQWLILVTCIVEISPAICRSLKSLATCEVAISRASSSPSLTARADTSVRLTRSVGDAHNGPSTSASQSLRSVGSLKRVAGPNRGGHKTFIAMQLQRSRLLCSAVSRCVSKKFMRSFV